MYKFLSIIFAFVLLATGPAQAEQKVPMLRMKVGKYFTKLTGGTTVVDQELNSLMTFQPTVLWDLPTFRSRIGYHFTGDFDSTYGLFPLAGVGFSGYFYPFGISSSVTPTIRNIVFQKYKTSPYVYGGLTPSNLSINEASTNTNFSAFILEITLGAGVDYPFSSNMLISVDLNYRFGSAPENEKIGSVDYSGFGIMFSYSTTYF